MIITWTPQRRDDKLELEWDTGALTINGETYDFSTLPEGATIPEVPSDWIVGEVHREDGKVRLTMILPHGLNPPQEVAYPEPTVIYENGRVKLPGDET